MASSENQGLQIALIILFGLMIVLSVTTFIFFKDYQEAETRATTDKAAADKATGDMNVEKGNVEMLKEIIGFKKDATMESVTASSTADFAKYAGALPADKKFYRDALDAVYASLQKVQADHKATSEQIATLQAVNAAFEKSATEKVTAAEEARNKAVADLDAERTKFMEAQKKSETEKKDLVDQLAKAQQEKAAEIEKVKKELEVVQKKVGTELELNKGLAEKNKRLQGETFAIDDGEVRSINVRNKAVWINVGRADDLRPQVTFNVHAAGLKPSDNLKKAKIEVTQILGEHLAEAKILEDSLEDPIVPGDKIYTPLWDPGRPEHFAIAGRIDFDGDGRDDHERLRNLIRLSGGVIDAELQPDGSIKGAMTVETRYLVLGPIESESKTREAYNSMVQTAKQYGADTLMVDKLLDRIGWHEATKLVRFGHDSNIDKVPPKDAPDGGLPRSTGSTSDLFKQRRPGATTSAY
jgi:hypothetical protein